MNNKIISHTLSTFRIIAISSLTIFTLYTVQAWTGPTVSAPGGNVSGPINTSGIAQTKTGNLTLGKLCLSGICNASWPAAAAGDNLGNHTATQGLNMSNYSIANVGSFFQTSGYYFYLPGPYSPGYGASTGGLGKVLTSDTWGYASWQTPSAGGVSSFNGATGAVAGVSSFNGSTGAVTGVSSITAGTGITVSPATGAVTVSNTGVTSITGGSCAVGKVVTSISTTGVATCGTAPVSLTKPWFCVCSPYSVTSSSANLSGTSCNNTGSGTKWQCAQIQ